MSKQQDVETHYANRRKKIIKMIKGEVAVIPSAAPSQMNRSQQYPFQQNSDFFYLTGFEEKESVLVLAGSSRGPRSVLFLRERNAAEERWDGERLGLKRAKRRFSIDEVRDIKDFDKDLPGLLEGAAVLHFGPGVNKHVDDLVWRLLQTPAGPRIGFPHILKDSRLITGEMRLIKDRFELNCLRRAGDITARAFVNFLGMAAQARSEKHAAALLEAEFTRLGAHGLSFPPIVASGKNATVLHHSPQMHPLLKHQLVLVDAGVLFNGYCSDLTRTIPVSGSFTEPQAKVYDAVHAALQEAQEKARPGNTLEAVHQAAVKAITSGLLRLGVLRGTVSELIQMQAYKPYFMHRTSHWLGLDVHDTFSIYHNGQLTAPNLRPLEPGNAVTIEPGLYFDAKDETVPVHLRGIGVRIEDSVLITAGGCEVLTGRMPSAREEIEALIMDQRTVS